MNTKQVKEGDVFKFYGNDSKIKTIEEWQKDGNLTFYVNLNDIDFDEQVAKRDFERQFDDMQKKIATEPKLVVKRRGKKNKW